MCRVKRRDGPVEDAVIVLAPGRTTARAVSQHTYMDHAGANAAGRSSEKVVVEKSRAQRTHGLFLLFGLAPWNVTSGLFAQLPLLVHASPQGAQLASFMDIATNLANFPMLAFIAAQSKASCAQRNRQALLGTTIYVCLVWSLATITGVSMTWHITVMNMSVFIIVGAFAAGCVGDLLMVCNAAS
eukprot:SAG31_NODE_898_length_11146_cov_25.421472_3_plen_185_part_00